MARKYPRRKKYIGSERYRCSLVKKGNETHYGYKNHAKVDADTKLITDYSVTSANVHDSREFLEFIDHTDNVIYTDSAYKSAEIDENLPKHVQNRIHEKGHRNNPLSEEQKLENRIKSKTRVWVEHFLGL